MLKHYQGLATLEVRAQGLATLEVRAQGLTTLEVRAQGLATLEVRAKESRLKISSIYIFISELMEILG